MVVDTDPLGEEVARRIETSGGTAIFLKADVSKVNDVATMTEKLSGTFGKTDILVNNAGISGGPAPSWTPRKTEGGGIRRAVPRIG